MRHIGRAGRRTAAQRQPLPGDSPGASIGEDLGGETVETRRVLLGPVALKILVAHGGVERLEFGVGPDRGQLMIGTPVPQETLVLSMDMSKICREPPNVGNRATNSGHSSSRG